MDVFNCLTLLSLKLVTKIYSKFIDPIEVPITHTKSSFKINLNSLTNYARLLSMFRGERFTVDISDDEENHTSHKEEESGVAQVPVPILDFVNDIKERDVAAPPPAPTLQTSSKSGFPEHKKRTRVSAFKQRRHGPGNGPAGPALRQPTAPSASTSASAPGPSSMKKPTLEDEKREIDLENQKKLAAMSDSQIEEERDELVSSLPPSLLELFLQRAKIYQTEGTQPHLKPVSPESKNPEPSKEVSKSLNETPSATGKAEKAKKSVSFAADTSEKEAELDPPIEKRQET
ncbi:hypothetical protein KEM56_003641, partial [Ascosphaera pollenicola]